MIRFDCRKTDQYDVAVLFAAMVRAEDKVGELYDTSLVQIGYDEALLRCRIAAAVIARDHVEQGDEWDNCWWLEVLEGFGTTMYLMGDQTEFLPHEREAAVTKAVHQLLSIQQDGVTVGTAPLPAY